jgi:hypothetical protein
MNKALTTVLRDFFKKLNIQSCGGKETGSRKKTHIIKNLTSELCCCNKN